MLRLQRDDSAQRFFPHFVGLPRQTVHQIHRKIFVARPSDALDGVHRVGIGVGAADSLQNGVVIALDAQTHPVKAFPLQPPQQSGGDGIGIGLEGDLRIVRHIEIAPYFIENGRHAVGAEKRRCAAAKIDGVHLVSGRQQPRLLDVGANGIQIAVHQPVILGGQGVKIAVLAFAAAKGNMNVNAKGSLVLACHGKPP